MLCGGHGVVTVVANVAPKLFADICRAALEGNIATARRLNEQLIPIYNTMFCEPSPAAPKWGLSLLGKCEPHVRLPLVAFFDRSWSSQSPSRSGKIRTNLDPEIRPSEFQTPFSDGLPLPELHPQENKMTYIKPIVVALALIKHDCLFRQQKEQPKLDYQSQSHRLVKLEVPT